jgi:hypothetical protein
VANSWSTSNIERWERGFAALSKFREREGHCCPSRDHLEGKFNLGKWISVQCYRKDLLPVDRKRRLDAIGFVWNCNDHAWEQGFAALVNFKQREGHCRVPTFHSEGNIRLGYWSSTQRRYKDEMSAERRTRLNEIGFLWNAAVGRPRKLSVPNLPLPPA